MIASFRTSRDVDMAQYGDSNTLLKIMDLV